MANQRHQGKDCLAAWHWREDLQEFTQLCRKYDLPKSTMTRILIDHLCYMKSHKQDKIIRRGLKRLVL